MRLVWIFLKSAAKTLAVMTPLVLIAGFLATGVSMWMDGSDVVQEAVKSSVATNFLIAGMLLEWVSCKILKRIK